MHVGTHEEASENDLNKIGKVTAAFQDGSSRTSAAECQGQQSEVDKSTSDNYGNSIDHFIGTGVFLRKQKRLSRPIDATEEDAQTLTACSKDTGEKRSLQKWSRGIWVCVSGGGMIQTWQPLYL